MPLKSQSDSTEDRVFAMLRAISGLSPQHPIWVAWPAKSKH